MVVVVCGVCYVSLRIGCGLVWFADACFLRVCWRVVVGWVGVVVVRVALVWDDVTCVWLCGVLVCKGVRVVMLCLCCALERCSVVWWWFVLCWFGVGCGCCCGVLCWVVCLWCVV